MSTKTSASHRAIGSPDGIGREPPSATWRDTLRDLLDEAIAAVFARPGRSALLSAGTVVGVATLVAALGLGTTARAQIDSQFNAYTATEVAVHPATGQSVSSLTTTQTAQAERIRGVTAAGRYWLTPTADQTWAPTPGSSDTTTAPLYAADPSTLQVLDLTLQYGRQPSLWDEQNHVPAVLLSASLAHRLGVTNVDPPDYVFLGGRAFLVTGVYSVAKRQDEVLLGAICTTAISDEYYDVAGRVNPQLLVATQPGSAQVVADQLPIAISPEEPSAVIASAPVSATGLRQDVDHDVERLLYVLAIVALAIGAFGITNGTLVSVLERTPEIGLRRALGARKRDLGGQLLIEGTVIGTAGGILGLSLGILTVLGLSAANGWTPTLNLNDQWALPLAGTLTGLLAAAYPAWRAATTTAAQALQRA